ncbi:MAG: hypothetical protein KGQ60_17030 [Planctomycetes bacterium]|nr:hypothetical protein [Planctomycetota bacterium]
MASSKHPTSIYTVMLILAMIFMLLANLLMATEYFRWRDTGPKASLSANQNWI